MNVLDCDRELDVTLARAAEGVALARHIQVSLAGVGRRRGAGGSLARLKVTFQQQ